MFDANFITNPYPTYARLRESAPIHWLPEFGRGTWLIPGYEGVAAALQEPRLSSRRTHRLIAQYPPEQQSQLKDFQDGFAKWVVFLDPPRHSVWRRLMSKGFTASIVAQSRPRITTLVNRLIDRAMADRKMDFIADFARPLPAITMVEFLGVDPEDRDNVIGWTDDIANFFGNANSPTKSRMRRSPRSSRCPGISNGCWRSGAPIPATIWAACCFRRKTRARNSPRRTNWRRNVRRCCSPATRPPGCCSATGSWRSSTTQINSLS